MTKQKELTNEQNKKDIKKFNSDYGTLMILPTEKKKKEFEVVYKFSDVVDTIEAYTKEEAEEEADRRINEGNEEENPLKDTYCYGVEVEEVGE